MTSSTSSRPVVHGGPAPAGRNPWWGVVVLTVTNLLPLVLVLNGALDLPLLVVCYLVEAVLITLVTRSTPPRAGAPRPADRFGSLGTRALFALVLVIFAGSALSATRWDGTTLAVLAGTVLLFVVGLRTAERQGTLDDARWMGTWGWHLAVIFIGSLVAVPYMEDLSVLLDAGWRPAPLGDFPVSGPALRINRTIVESGVAPEVMGTAIFVVFKTVNEVLMAGRRAYLATRSG